MALLGISLIVASVVYVIIRPPTWLSSSGFFPRFFQWRGFGGAITDGSVRPSGTGPDGKEKDTRANGASGTRDAAPKKMLKTASSVEKGQRDSFAMPPPPPPTITPPSIQPPTIQPPTLEEPEEATTPKATAKIPSQPVPSFTLSDPISTSSLGSMMPPPPAPGRIPSAGRVPSLGQFPAANSIQRARGPVPNRGPPSSLSPSGLAPPPSHSSKPQKPSRKVMLEPGCSPLDWARISGPNADLRGIPPSSPYLKVTPTMLKNQTGRKGKDAWMALNGKVYNITPYAKFHPGGIPELLRGAARDGTQLFGEIHPWVNYETMLSACLVGLMIEEPDPEQRNEMEEMD